MTPDEKIALLENKLDRTLMLLQEMVHNIRSFDNEMCNYFVQEINMLYYIDCINGGNEQ